MKRYTPEELAEVLAQHAKWLEEDGTGRRADLRDADLCDANLRDANLCDANLRGADLRRADLRDANLCDANLKAATLRVFEGLYTHTCMAIISVEGVPWVRMGCLWKTVEDWDKLGIRNSNRSEFPDDGSDKCEQRVRAFEFVKNEALLMEKSFNKKGAK